MSEVKVYKMMSPCISQHIDSYYQETRIVIYQKGFDAHFSGEGIVDMVEKSDFDALAKKLKEHEEKGLLIYGRKIELLNETNRKLSEENAVLVEELKSYSRLPDGKYYGPDDVYENLADGARAALLKVGKG